METEFQWDQHFANLLLAYCVHRNVAVDIGMDQFTLDLLIAIDKQQQAEKMIELTGLFKQLEYRVRLDEIKADIQELKSRINGLTSIADEAPDVGTSLFEISVKQKELDDLLTEIDGLDGD